MRKFRRIMSRVGDGVCVVLMVLTVVIFVRGYWGTDVISYETTRCEGSIASDSGRLLVIHLSHSPMDVQTDVYWNWQPTGNPRLAYYEWWFWYYPGWSGFAVAVPLWFLFLLFAIKPTWSLVTMRRRKQRLQNVAKPCVNCGYDLRGNPGAEVCPECGAKVKAESGERKAAPREAMPP